MDGLELHGGNGTAGIFKSNTLASILPVHLLLLEDKNKSKNILQF
jgi:hypothetical protein